MTSSSSTQPRQFLPVEFLLDSSSLRPPLASPSTPLGIPRPPLLFPSAPPPNPAARPKKSLAGVHLDRRRPSPLPARFVAARAQDRVRSPPLVKVRPLMPLFDFFPPHNDVGFLDPSSPEQRPPPVASSCRSRTPSTAPPRHRIRLVTPHAVVHFSDHEDHRIDDNIRARAAGRRPTPCLRPPPPLG